MAQYSLNIYGENDEIVKTYSTDIVRWGVYMRALELEQELGQKSAVEKIKGVNGFICSIFAGLTPDELNNADVGDILNTFRQIINKAQGLSSKNG